jgi:ribokinase
VRDVTAARDLDLLVVGDANADLVLRGDVVPRFGQAEQLLDAADLVPAGSAGIVAAGAARLGLRTALAAHVGADLFGRLVVAALEERGVDLSALVVEHDLPTGLSVILSAPHDRAILTLLGALPRLDPDRLDDGLLRRARHVHVASWFLLPGLHGGGGARLLARARSAGCTTSLDTNWDPAGRWDGVLDALEHVDVLLPNAAELTAMTRNPDAGAAADVVHAAGSALALKAGAAGAAGRDATGRHAAPGLALDVVDTTGAGDSFDAGFLAAFLDGRPFAECLRWAAVAGSLSTRAAGGTTAQATRAELLGLV